MSVSSPAITPEVIAEHGLTTEEYEIILKSLGREPNLTELGIFSVMWSADMSPDEFEEVWRTMCR